MKACHSPCRCFPLAACPLVSGLGATVSCSRWRDSRCPFEITNGTRMTQRQWAGLRPLRLEDQGPRVGGIVVCGAPALCRFLAHSSWVQASPTSDPGRLRQLKRRDRRVGTLPPQSGRDGDPHLQTSSPPVFCHLIWVGGGGGRRWGDLIRGFGSRKDGGSEVDS